MQKIKRETHFNKWGETKLKIGNEWKLGPVENSKVLKRLEFKISSSSMKKTEGGQTIWSLKIDFEKKHDIKGKKVNSASSFNIWKDPRINL